MIKIIGNKDHTIYYECDCGVKGRCMVKPLSREKPMIVDVRCPVCMDAERVKLLPGQVVTNEDGEFSWACVIYNEITDYELREDLNGN